MQHAEIVMVSSPQVRHEYFQRIGLGALSGHMRPLAKSMPVPFVDGSCGLTSLRMCEGCQWRGTLCRLLRRKARKKTHLALGAAWMIHDERMSGTKA